MLTRLGGQPMAVNPDLIEKAEATPDTVITLVDGHKFVVAEAVPDVVARVRAWRASVAAEAFTMSVPAPSEGAVEHLPAPRHPVEPRHPADRPLQALDGEAAAADGSGGAPLARVLRLPAREE